MRQRKRIRKHYNKGHNLRLWWSTALSISILQSWLGFHHVEVAVQAEKAYPLGCSHRDPAYYDYENSVFPPVPILIDGVDRITEVPIKSTEDYLLVRRLGAGKFSDVFEAVDAEKERRQKILSSSENQSLETIDPETLVVLKCLKPVAERKIKRELLVLRHVSRLPNLARIKGIVLPKDYFPNKGVKKYQIRSMPTLVLEHGHGDWFCHPIKQQKQKQYQGSKDNNMEDPSALYLTEYEIRYYLLHLLVALDHLHSCGIMHRDVKPRNVLIDRRATRNSPFDNRGRHTSPLMLIDLGLADFYHPGTRYNVRVASRHYKSPELLLGPLFGYYDYAIDLWGVGCILAGLLFRKEPFFRGKNNLDQLGVILEVLGTTDLLLCIAAHEHATYKLLPSDVKGLLDGYIANGKNVHRRPWRDFLPDPTSIPTLFESQGMDLLDKLLVYDGEKRWTAKQAMYHPFFDPVRKNVLGQVPLAS